MSWRLAPLYGREYAYRRPAQGVRMIFARQIRGYGVSLLAAVVLAACSNQQEPARLALDGVNTAISAVGPQVQKYMPDQYTPLQARVSALKDAFDKGNYQQVLNDAPTLMNDIQGSGAVARAKKAQRIKSLMEQWPRLTASIPDLIAAVQARVDVLAKNKKEAAKVDLPAAQASMADVSALWAKAQQAASGGDIESAADAAKEVQSRIEAAAAAIKFVLPRPAPPQSH
jgi:hypothetical protein